MEQQLHMLKIRFLEEEKQRDIVEKQVLTQIKYFHDIFDSINDKVCNAEKILHRQVFSQ